MSNFVGYNIALVRRLLKVALFYAVAGLAAGIFERAFSSFNGFEGSSSLSTMHTHLLMLGMVVHLLVMLFVAVFQVEGDSSLDSFLIIYNFGVLVSVFGALWRGVHQVMNSDLAAIGAWYSTAISATSGLGHGLIGAGLLVFFWIAKRALDRVDA